MASIKLAGGGERAQYLLREYNDNTIRFVLNYPTVLDPEILCEATRALVESVDVLHSTFLSGGTGTYWRVNENLSHTHYFYRMQVDGDPAVTADSVSVMPIYPEDKAQLYVTLIQSETASSVVVRMSHLVVDGGDGRYLLGKLAEAYNRIAGTGSAEGLAVKNGSRKPEQVYEKFTYKDIKSMIGVPLSSYKTEYPYTGNDGGMVRLTKEIIPAETMAAARQKAKAVGATANDLLLTAFYRAYAKLEAVDETGPMSITSMMDLRRHCVDGESEGLCNMSGSLPTELAQGVSGSFADTLAVIAEQTAKTKEDPLAGLLGMPILHGATKSLPIWLLQLAVSKVYGSMSLGLTNLGNVKCAELALNGVAPTGGLFGGPLKKKPGMQIAVVSFDGECVLTVTGEHTAGDAQMLRQTLEDVKQEIETYANT